MELHTDDFPLSLNRKFYDYLIENFKLIAQECSQLDAIIQRLDTNEKSIADLQTRMKTAEDHIKKLDDIIFGMEYIDDTDEFMLDNSTPNPSEVEINDDVAVDDDNAEVVKELPHEVISNEVS